ncbi:Grip75 [Carabus blaptoides fortunei]
MIHEALLYLWNCPGKFCSPNAEEEWFNMIELRDFLHPGERKLLQRIMHVALDHHHIQEFIKLVFTQNTQKLDIQAVLEVFQGNNFHTVNTEKSLVERKPGHNVLEDQGEYLQEGLYLKAFCNGLDAVLQDYRNDIVDLEKEILKDPQLPLTFVLSRVERYVTLFDAVKSMIRVVKTERVHGCLLMGRLLKYYNCGIKQVADAASTIICSINTMFYRHLCNWIIFGDLVDVYQEFFICDAKCADDNFLWNFSGNETRNDLEVFSEALKGHRIRRPPKVRKFYVKENMVPSNITIELAQTILFMGRMVWIIRNDPTTLQDDKLILKLKRDIWDGKEAYYYQKLRDLENLPFNLAQFEKAIEDCRLCLTKYLWKVMVEEAMLFDHLQLIRDYYALGRGELFQQFIVSVQENVKDTPNDYLVLKLNSTFKETVKRMYLESDRTYKRFQLFFPTDSDRTNVYNPWLHIQMNFEIVWPLHIIFHPGAMALYNKLFNFLMRVKKTQIDLQKLWKLHMEGKHNVYNGVSVLRNTLMFLINNLQYYLQVDVIEAQFAVLIKSVSNAQSVENIIKLHSEFLGNLMSRTFLMTINDKSYNKEKDQLYKIPSLNYEASNPVHTTILLFLQLCDKFCTEASVWGTELTDVEQRELAELHDKCSLLVEHLLGMLYSLREHTSGCHLQQLLHRIDFNRWFSKNKPDFNLSVV